MSQRQSTRGFSIAELLVVVVIVAFASSVALLGYSNYRKDAEVRTSAEKVKALMAEARMRAIADDLPSAVVFDLTNQAVWIDDLNSDQTVRRPKVVAPEGLGNVVIEELKINTFTYSNEVRRVVFEPDGANPLVVVTLRRDVDDANVDENYYSVQMYPASPVPRVWPNVRK